jgi:hypothetical protein
VLHRRAHRHCVCVLSLAASLSLNVVSLLIRIWIWVTFFGFGVGYPCWCVYIVRRTANIKASAPSIPLTQRNLWHSDRYW